MSSWRTTRLNQVWKKTRVLGLDTFYLASALVFRKDTSQTARDILVAQARSNNNVASSFLMVDKEVGLFRYYGSSDYLREKQLLPFFSATKRLIGGSAMNSNGGGNEDPDKDSEKKDKPQVARVAFMITSTQRTELSKRLKYSGEEIKQLKPLEASLILSNDLSPTDAEDKLPGLVQDYNDELTRQHQEAKLQAEKLASQREVEVETPVEQQSQEKEETLLLSDVPDQDTFQEASASDVDQSAGSKLWYEVVETRVSDNSSIAVALYQNEDEAKLCLELKESFEDRRAREKDKEPATTYAIRKTVK